jgi:hypothetical protein
MVCAEHVQHLGRRHPDTTPPKYRVGPALHGGDVARQPVFVDEDVVVRENQKITWAARRALFLAFEMPRAGSTSPTVGKRSV